MKLRLFYIISILALLIFSNAHAAEITSDKALETANKLWKTSCLNAGSSRKNCFKVLQKCADDCSREDYIAYRFSSASDAATIEKSKAMLAFYNAAFEKVLAEIKTQTPKNGEVFLWLIYNMGYIVKTPNACFGIDIPVRRAAELAPYLDFLLITHNHSDHFDTELVAAMQKQDKPVISNFINNSYMSKIAREYKVKGVSITARPADHNAVAKNFVMTFEIDCGEDSGNISIFHVGDSCDYKQLAPQKSVDIFIPHVAVGLDIPKCVNTSIKPKLTLVSHCLELSHAVDKWRWSYDFCLNVCASCKNKHAVLPVWGEKIAYSSKQ